MIGKRFRSLPIIFANYNFTLRNAKKSAFFKPADMSSLQQAFKKILLYYSFSHPSFNPKKLSCRRTILFSKTTR